MAKPELLDVYDEFGRHLDVVERSVAHAQGLWHRVFHLLIVAPRPSGPAVILQLRAADKLVFPGLLDLSVTGHLAAGEHPNDGLRELQEELGVELVSETLVPLGVRRMVDNTPEGINREFCHVFLALDDRPLDRYSPQSDEVEAVIELPIGLGLAVLSNRRTDADVPAWTAKQSAERFIVTRERFVPEPPLGEVSEVGDHPAYWIALLTMALRLADGASPVAI